MAFKKATKQNARVRIALCGNPGCGKTFSGLSIASHLGARAAVIDTDGMSASKYSDLFDFDVSEIANCHPNTFISEIKAAAAEGYPVLMIDTLSHAWAGPGGVLDVQSSAAKASGSESASYRSWKDPSALHQRLIEEILGYPGHVIVTLRMKVAYEQTKNKDGKWEVKKVGLQPVQRAGVEYEFDLVGDLDPTHALTVTKSRIHTLPEHSVHLKPGKDMADTILQWLADDPARATQLAAEIDQIGLELYDSEWQGHRTQLLERYATGGADLHAIGVANLSSLLNILLQRIAAKKEKE